MSEPVEFTGNFWSLFTAGDVDLDDDDETIEFTEGTHLVRLIERCNTAGPNGEEVWFVLDDMCSSRERAEERIENFERMKYDNPFGKRKLKPGLVNMRITEHTTDEQLEVLMKEATETRAKLREANLPPEGWVPPEYPKYRISEYIIEITKKEA
jgi:hypothetical protein